MDVMFSLIMIIIMMMMVIVIIVIIIMVFISHNIKLHILVVTDYELYIIEINRELTSHVWFPVGPCINPNYPILKLYSTINLFTKVGMKRSVLTLGLHGIMMWGCGGGGGGGEKGAWMEEPVQSTRERVNVLKGQVIFANCIR